MERLDPKTHNASEWKSVLQYTLPLSMYYTYCSPGAL